MKLPFLFLSLTSQAIASDDLDRIWNHAVLYTSDSSLVRKVALSGRLQGDAVWVDSDTGNFHDLVWRRFRFGFKSSLENNLVVQVEADFDLNEFLDNGYRRLTDAYIGWTPSDSLELRVLKHSAGFTLDGATSSKSLLTMERNNLTNNLWFTAEYFTGISARGNLGNGLSYRAGVYSADPDDEISFVEGSFFTLSSLGWDFSSGTQLDSASIRMDYVYQDADPLNNTRDFSHVITLVSKWEDGNWGLWTDLSSGRGHADQGDIWGAVLMPFYNSSERLQWVGRLTFLDADDANSLRLGRYEEEITPGYGDRYEEVYLGLNYFFHGHKLKWQSGLQFANMNDSTGGDGRHQGWGFTTGLRLFW